MSIAEALKPVLQSTTLKDVSNQKQNVFTLEHNLTVADAMKLLAKKHILSAPLVAGFDLEDVGSNGGMVDAAPSLLGWIDIADVVRALIEHIKQHHNPLPTKMLALMSVLEEDGPQFSQKILVSLAGGSDRGLVYQINSDHSLMQVIRDVFLKPSSDSTTNVAVHRIAVFDTHGEVVNIVSQTDIIRFLHQNMNLLGDLADKSIADLGLLNGKPPVIAVSPHLPTLLAYQHMLEAGVSGAAVVADTGELIANLSLSELRSIQPEHFGALALPVGEFLALLHGTVYVGYSHITSGASTHPFFAKSAAAGTNKNESDVRILTVSPETTFRQMVSTLIDNHVHRIYVSQNKDKPSADACITLTDLLRVMVGVW